MTHHYLSPHHTAGNESLRNQLQHYRRNLKWMKATRFSNVLYMHPQVRHRLRHTRMAFPFPLFSFIPMEKYFSMNTISDI